MSPRGCARASPNCKNTVIPEGVGVEITRDYGATANDKALKLIEKLVFATASVVALVFFAHGPARGGDRRHRGGARR